MSGLSTQLVKAANYLARRLVLSLCMLALLTLLIPRGAEAISNLFPDTNTSSPGRGYAVVAIRNANPLNDARLGSFKVFIDRNNIAGASIILQEICNVALREGSITDPAIQLWSNNSLEQPQMLLAGDQGCSGNDKVFSGFAPSALSTIAGHTDFYTYTVIVQLSSGDGAQSFEVNAGAGNYATFTELPNPETPGQPANNAFAILNEQNFTIPDGVLAENEFEMRFATTCESAPGVPFTARDVYLKWFDGDWGQFNEVGNPITFVLFDETDGVNVPITINGTTYTTVTGPDIGGDDVFSQGRFRVEPAHNYSWRWTNVDRNNVLRLWMPYSEFNVIQTCPPVTDYAGAAIGSCAALTGWFADRSDPANSNFDVRVWSWTAGGPVTTTWIEDVDLASPSSPVAGDHGWSMSWPAASLSATSPTFYTVHAFDDARATQLYTIAADAQVGPCIGEWDYDPTLSDNPGVGADARAGEAFGMHSTVRNNGDGDGPTYGHLIRVRAGGPGAGWRFMADRNIDAIISGGGGVIDNSSVKQVRWPSEFPIAADSITNGRTAQYQVQNAPFHGDEICFEGELSPAKGISPPLLAVEDEVDTTWDVDDPGGISGHAEDQVYTECITIYNMRFALSPPTVVEPSLAFPGTDINFDVTIWNDATPPDNATPGPVGLNVPVTITATNGTIVSGGSTTVPAGTAYNGSIGPETTTVRVSNAVGPGDDVCINITFGPTSGYSDGDRTRDEGTYSESHCVVVAERPFFTVADHDAWAGAVWDAGGACSVTTNAEGDIKSFAATLSGNDYGGMGEYAAYAIESVIDFGTRNNPVGSSLTFANDDPLNLGNLFNGAPAPPRCIEDFFGLLYNASSLSPPGQINTIGSAGDETISINGNARYTSGADIQARKTIIINGDLRIDNDIQYDDFTYNAATNSVSGPSLAIIVRGNIYIDESVEELNGLFIAQPRADGSGGIIDTCTRGGSAVTELSTGDCDEQLTINGAVIAEHFHLRRTYGGVLRSFNGSQAGGAEEFVFNPMMYLHQPLFESVGGATGSEFPFLQIKDLPPVF